MSDQDDRPESGRGPSDDSWDDEPVASDGDSTPVGGGVRSGGAGIGSTVARAGDEAPAWMTFHPTTTSPHEATRWPPPGCIDTGGRARRHVDIRSYASDMRRIYMETKILQQELAQVR